MSLSLTNRRVPAIVGALAGVVLLAGGIAVWAQTGEDGPARTAATSVTADAGAPAEVAAAPAPAPAEETTTTTAAPTTTVAAKTATPPTTAARSTTKATTPTTTAPAAAATTTAPAATAPKVRSGQRITPTTAQIQAAVTSLHQRIPLFAPTDSQLMAFADAACTQFDQGQTEAQVEDAVRKAVTYIQGASLSSADAAFAVQTVVALRCPGYLP